jgi:hypothetical protein
MQKAVLERHVLQQVIQCYEENKILKTELARLQLQNEPTINNDYVYDSLTIISENSPMLPRAERCECIIL